MIKISPIEIESNWFPFWSVWAVTLWPVIFYKRPHKTECIRQHELYHWHQALKFGVLPWYLAYFFLQIFYFRRPANEHPLEKEAYAVQWKCEGR